jgi:VIT family protein
VSTPTEPHIQGVLHTKFDASLVVPTRRSMPSLSRVCDRYPFSAGWLRSDKVPFVVRLPMPGKRVLEPIDRVSEVLFGLIMVLGFTRSLSIAEAGRDDVRAMLIGALGCNLAWGIIDAILYLMGCLANHGRNLAVFQAVREAGNSPRAHNLIADALPPVVAGLLQPAELEAIRQRLTALPDPPPHARLYKNDWLGGAGVFLLVFLSTFPVAIPFMLMGNAAAALRISNVVAIVLLFLAGYVFGQLTGRHPVWVGCAMVVLGVGLVGLTMALGG